MQVPHQIKCNCKNTSATDYGYDVNGNLLTDKNKRLNGNTGIDADAAGGAIQYNYLNLPYLITAKYDDGSAKGTVKYIYDAAGNKLEKITDEIAVAANSQTRTVTTTDYISLFVYEKKDITESGTTINGTSALQYISQEEGRMREQYNTDGSLAKYNFDYFIKDHLGNVRMILTDEQKKEVAMASMETAAQSTETQLFYNVDNTSIRYQINQIAGYPTDNTTNPNNYVAKLNGSNPNTRIGPARIIKVMSGDAITASTISFFTDLTTNNDTHVGWQNIASQLIGALFGSGLPGAYSGGHGIVSALDAGNASFSNASGYNSFFNQNNNASINNPLNKPKAYLNILFFDEYFNLDKTISKVVFAATNANELNVITSGTITAAKNGYVYIYVSNESSENVNVFFDNLNVQQVHGPLLEETHYYPFGLTMSGISSKALSFGDPENKLLFNGGNELQNKEFSDGSGLEFYDAVHRMYDVQIGRFGQVDPLAGASFNFSPYAFANDNPIGYNDPFGLMGDTIRTNGDPNKTPGFGPDPNKGAVLPEVTVKSTKPAHLHWLNYPDMPASSDVMLDWRVTIFQRIAGNKPLLQGEEPDWVKDNLKQYQLEYQAEQDYRTNQIAALLIIASPILIAMAPEIIALSQEGIAAGRSTALAANELYRVISITVNGDTQILLSRFIKNAPDLAKMRLI